MDQAKYDPSNGIHYPEANRRPVGLSEVFDTELTKNELDAWGYEKMVCDEAHHVSGTIPFEDELNDLPECAEKHEPGVAPLKQQCRVGQLGFGVARIQDPKGE